MAMTKANCFNSEGMTIPPGDPESFNAVLLGMAIVLLLCAVVLVWVTILLCQAQSALERLQRGLDRKLKHDDNGRAIRERL